MAIRRLNDSMSIISELSDEPNDVDGLSSSELKAKFDASGTIIKEYLNNSLIPDVEADIVESISDLVVQSGNMPAGGAKGQALIKESGANFDWGFKTIIDIPAGGIGGYILTKASDDDYDMVFSPPRTVDWTLEASFETAGTHTWTAPDAYGDGQPYTVGAYIIGGGGGGGASSMYSTSTQMATVMATGGASGYAKCAEIEVTPGSEYPIVVGEGGNAMQRAGTLPDSSAMNFSQEGNAGGASAFAGITANGGGGGWGAACYSHAEDMFPNVARAANGGQGGDAVNTNRFQDRRITRAVAPALGRPTVGMYGNAPPIPGGSSDPSSTFNRFTGEHYLAAGGYAFGFGYVSGSNIVYVAEAQKGYTFSDGRKAGDGVGFPDFEGSSNMTAESATAPGCGGGAAALRNRTTGRMATSGAGAAGAVYIYIRRQKR